MFFHPSSAFHAVQRGETEDFIRHYQLLIDTPMVFHLIINVEELIQGIKQHFLSVALMQNVLILQGVALHSGRLKACNALGLMLPVLLRSEGECPPKPPLKYGFEPTGNNQYTLIRSLRSTATFKCDKQGHARMHPMCPTPQTMHHGYLQG